MEGLSRRQVLFGMNMGWHLEQWSSSDDSVRGGQSKSYLESSGTGVRFRGILDIEALGGAGFASQRTGDDRHWDLSSFSGLDITIDSAQSDDNVYTLILKDEILPRNPANGRQQSTTSWEYDFCKSECRPGLDDNSASTGSLFISWNHFKPTYRGKPNNGPRSLDVSDIKRVSIMIRSFFGSQQGEFRLAILSIVATSSLNLSASSPAVANRHYGPDGAITGAVPAVPGQEEAK